MIIKNLNDEELFEYMMNSEYSDGLNPEEHIYLLIKWKSFYRIIHGQYGLLKKDYESINEKIIKKQYIYNNEIKELKKELNTSNELIRKIQNKKLSWIERINGKVKI